MSLLEELLSLTSLSYISDLRNCENALQIRAAAARIEACMYSAGEWSEAAEYITNAPFGFASAEDARDSLLNFCK
jgi:hypothetical protein